jgi:hypothetical protein
MRLYMVFVNVLGNRLHPRDREYVYSGVFKLVQSIFRDPTIHVPVGWSEIQQFMSLWVDQRSNNSYPCELIRDPTIHDPQGHELLDLWSTHRDMNCWISNQPTGTWIVGSLINPQEMNCWISNQPTGNELLTIHVPVGWSEIQQFMSLWVDQRSNNSCPCELIRDPTIHVPVGWLEIQQFMSLCEGHELLDLWSTHRDMNCWISDQPTGTWIVGSLINSQGHELLDLWSTHRDMNCWISDQPM